MTVADPLDPFLYPWWAFVYFGALYVASQCTVFILSNCVPIDSKANFRGLTEEKKRNVVTYVMEVCVTTLALVSSMYGGVDILWRQQDNTTEQRVDYMIVSLMAISVLYTWELMYRIQFGWPLFIHHIITLLLMQLAMASFFMDEEVTFIRFALMMSLYATTEQSSFVALFCYRMKVFQNHQQRMFLLAAWQSILFKAAITVGLIVYYFQKSFGSIESEDRSTPWAKFWIYMFLPLVALLFGSQIYASRILYALAKRTKADSISERDAGTSDDDDDNYDGSSVIEHGEASTAS